MRNSITHIRRLNTFAFYIWRLEEIPFAGYSYSITDLGEEFLYYTFVHSLPKVFPDFWADVDDVPVLKNRKFKSLSSSIKSYFGLNQSEFLNIFCPNKQKFRKYYGYNLSAYPNRDEVSEHIFSFIKAYVEKN